MFIEKKRAKNNAKELNSFIVQSFHFLRLLCKEKQRDSVPLNVGLLLIEKSFSRIRDYH
jgi:hypothetical protein